MTHYGTWSPYAGSSSIILAVALLIVTGVLIYLAIRLPHPLAVKRPGKVLSVALVVIWLLSVITFLVAASIYGLADEQQMIHFTGPMNPIAPVTITSEALAFFVILSLSGRSTFWVAVGSAIVGAIAAPMIFELPFDLIVMWRTYPPAPEILFTLLFFLPLFLVEILSFAMLTFSPLMKLSRSTLFLLAGMFLIFAVWAVFGFAYPAAPLPIALNMISKILAFATAVSLFLPPEKSAWFARQAGPGQTGNRSMTDWTVDVPSSAPLTVAGAEPPVLATLVICSLTRQETVSEKLFSPPARCGDDKKKERIETSSALFFGTDI